MLGIAAVATLILGYLPVNFVSGIRNPDTNVNTIVTSILLIAGCGLFLSLARSPQGSKNQYIKNTEYYLQNDQLFRIELEHRVPDSKTAARSEIINAGKELLTASEELKSYILKCETGVTTFGPDFVTHGTWLGETYTAIYFEDGTPAMENYNALLGKLEQYNLQCEKAPEMHTVKEFSILSQNGNERVYDTLNKLVQLQLFILQNERIAAEG
jgi:hypothetical protein